VKSTKLILFLGSQDVRQIDNAKGNESVLNGVIVKENQNVMIVQ